jgi:hypothetical protein
MNINVHEARLSRHSAVPTASSPLPSVLCPCVADCLPLHVRNRIGSATGERLDVILPGAWTGTACEPRGRGRDALVGIPASLLARLTLNPGKHAGDALAIDGASLGAAIVATALLDAVVFPEFSSFGVALAEAWMAHLRDDTEFWIGIAVIG